MVLNNKYLIYKAVQSKTFLLSKIIQLSFHRNKL